jgi:hypothetical protein
MSLSDKHTVSLSSLLTLLVMVAQAARGVLIAENCPYSQPTCIVSSISCCQAMVANGEMVIPGECSYCFDVWSGDTLGSGVELSSALCSTQSSSSMTQCANRQAQCLAEGVNAITCAVNYDACKGNTAVELCRCTVRACLNQAVTPCDTLKCTTCRTKETRTCNDVRTVCQDLHKGLGAFCSTPAAEGLGGIGTLICQAYADVMTEVCDIVMGDCSGWVNEGCASECNHCTPLKNRRDRMGDQGLMVKRVDIPQLRECDKGICKNPNVIRMFNNMRVIALETGNGRAIDILNTIKTQCNTSSCK